MSNMRQRNILSALNESAEAVIEMQPTVGVDAPKEIYQCTACKGFVTTTVGEEKGPEVCPVCGVDPLVVTHYGTVVDPQTQPTRNATVMMDPVSTPEAEEILEEALTLLASGRVEQYANSYRNLTSMNRKGELVAVVESGVARRRMTASHKSAYRLSENYTKKSTINESKIHAIRLNAFMINESRSIKRRVIRKALMEGINLNDEEKLNKLLDEEIDKSDYTEYIEDVMNDTDVIEKIAESDEDGAVTDTVGKILTDAGLEVVSSEVIDQDDESTVIKVRVVDEDNVEIHTDDLAESLEDMVDGSVSILGAPLSSSEDIIDLEIIISNSSAITEYDELEGEDDLEESEDPEDEEELNERYSYLKKSKSRRSLNESRTRRSKRSKMITEGKVLVASGRNVSKRDVVGILSELLGGSIPAALTESGELVIPFEDADELDTIQEVIDSVIGEDKFDEYAEIEVTDNIEESDDTTELEEDLALANYAIANENGELLTTSGEIIDPSSPNSEDHALLFETEEEATEFLQDMREPGYHVVSIEVITDLDESEEEEEEDTNSINEFMERVKKLASRR